MEYKKNVNENAMKLNINETYCKKEGIIKSYNKREELRKLKLKQKASGIHFHFKLTIYNLPGWIIFGSPSAVIKNTTCNTCLCFCLRALEQSLLIQFQLRILRVAYITTVFYLHPVDQI